MGTVASKRLRWGLLVGLWLCAVGVAFAGFYASWSHAPELNDVLMSLTLLAPFALPGAFGGIVGQLLGETAAIVFGVAYWPVLITLEVQFLRRGHPGYFIAAAPLVLVPAFMWFVLGTGMMGI